MLVSSSQMTVVISSLKSLSHYSRSTEPARQLPLVGIGWCDCELDQMPYW